MPTALAGILGTSEVYQSTPVLGGITYKPRAMPHRAVWCPAPQDPWAWLPQHPSIPAERGKGARALHCLHCQPNPPSLGRCLWGIPWSPPRQRQVWRLVVGAQHRVQSLRGQMQAPVAAKAHPLRTALEVGFTLLQRLLRWGLHLPGKNAGKWAEFISPHFAAHRWAACHGPLHGPGKCQHFLGVTDGPC